MPKDGCLSPPQTTTNHRKLHPPPYTYGLYTLQLGFYKDAEIQEFEQGKDVSKRDRAMCSVGSLRWFWMLLLLRFCLFRLFVQNWMPLVVVLCRLFFIGMPMTMIWIAEDKLRMFDDFEIQRKVTRKRKWNQRDDDGEMVSKKNELRKRL
ncbi:hypothetical protein HanPSC8_Chr08g0325821 [Helianthus annuus]|nr:hypothetical protein HanPSC8_Chr08g0325821 [Helianthus annuus]